ncbi:hypothetical protein [Nocardia sp. CS682]|uniref:hypothetical protein n=1 Tax=Nocardia sp. CS682 TaxID=1047172 RepID=UPI001F0EAC63|nr:hypothetical protein [Nocardia sp. CS682]
MKEAILGLRDRWYEYTERMRDAGWIPADADIHAVATAIMGVLPGFILQHLIIGDVDPETLARGIRTLLPYGSPDA